MTEEEKAVIKDIAFEAARVIKVELVNGFKMQLELHKAQCPATESVRRWPKQIAFLIIGVAIGSGSGVLGLLKLFKFF